MTLAVIVLLEISFGYEIQKSFDGVRNRPVLKVSFYDRQQQQQPPHGKVIKVKSGDKKFQKYKREYSDNVKGELKPQSREDIYNIKRLSFHGRNSPSAEPLIGKNISYHQPPAPPSPPPPPTTTTTSKPKFSEPIHRNDYYIPRSKSSSPHKSSKPNKKSISPSVDNQVIVSKPRYVPHSEKFYPLMRPSPINVMPTEPPSFDTVRSYVRYLKMRQEKFFSDFDDDEEKPSPVAAAIAQPKISVPFAGEIDYFKEREKELAREEERRNQFSPADFGSNDRISDIDDDVLPPYREDHYASNESEIRNASHNDDDDDNEEEENDNSESSNERGGGEEVQAYYDGREDYDDAVAEEESRKKEQFVPFRLYAQVRHMEADHHEQPKKKNIKEKVSLAKKNIYYKEEGYEDKNYDHGADKVNYGYDENIKELTPKQVRKRAKRSTDGDSESLDVSKLPVALAYIKKSELPNLTGVKLLKHLDELLKNSSIYLPDEDDSNSRPVKFAKPKRSQKYPYYNTPDTVLSEMSAHRYSENLKNYPRHKESLYKLKNVHKCDEIEEDIDPVPSDIEEKGKPTRFNNKPQRLRGLGDKIGCLREKYFGKDPFDNPLFHEDEYVAASIPIPVTHNLSRQANPLITVYDDVINNIRSGFLDEFKQKREAQDALKVASEQISIKAEQIKIPNLSAVSTLSNNFHIFDINNFTPKFTGVINHDLIDDIDELDDAKLESEGSAAAELLKINKQQLLLENDKLKSANYRGIEGTEKPKVKRNNKNIHSDVIEDILPPPPKTIPNNKIQKAVKAPQLTIQKFRRFVPNTIPYPAKHISTIYLPQKPASKTTYRFKLL
jgi:hypothetical protein